MRKTVFALALLLLSFSYALTVSHSIKEDKIIFIINDDDSYAQANLTLFILKDGVQIRGVQRTNVLFPHYFEVPYNESGTYELRVLDQNNRFVSSSVNVSAAKPQTEEEKQKEEKGASETAIWILIIGILVVAALFIMFIKERSDNK